ncbi:pyridoxamine 5'-phosphate oxidase family protein [Actinomadura logoneensis]|uniref:Pyridoxamine 5'-phosphate oxidase family protein n=1 Tax=Actinomadura logoneensis TaxID=2293572 RepID=A0A372JQT6_9ACTN|nr:pyridoxamine 5'-phosphate oxidase family protein [Actinomadura logoneensis]RFU41708.1 pyridoxamine 5'-phosphate oxidase family protein [Actinomadura logoneensis]
MSTGHPPPLSATARTSLGRKRDRGRTDRAELHAVLDEGRVCHLGVVVDGAPRVLPTAYGRDGDTLYLHGSSGASSLLAAPTGEICVTVTHLDALVLARSANNHSMNYRSAMIYGVPRRVTDDAEKLHGLRAVVEHITPGRWDVIRAPNRKELASTAVLALSLDEASVKMRGGQVVDEPEDYALDVWAGLVPVHQTYGVPVPDPALRPGLPVPGHILATFPTG